MSQPNAADMGRWAANDGPQADYNREVYFRRHMVQPPGMVYVTVDDIFVLKVFNPTTAANVNVSIRYLDPDGNVLPQFQQFLNIPASSTPRSLNFRGSEGYVLSATISTPGASAGAVYVQLEVGRGLGAQDLTEGHLLIGGYPGSFAALGYPQTQPQPPSAGVGVSRSITIANPPPTTNWSITVPAGTTWVINSLHATLATSAVVATRKPDLLVLDGAGNVLMDAGAGAGEAASLTYTWTWAPGLTTAGSIALSMTVGLPSGFRLNAGWVIQLSMTSIQAGDQWSNIALSVMETVSA
jgi:hypothetical protein